MAKERGTRAPGVSGLCLLFAACAMLLNQVFLAVIFPLPDGEAPEQNQLSAETGFPSLRLKPASLAPGFSGCSETRGGVLAEPEEATAWKDIANPLAKLSPASLRLLPRPEDNAPTGHHWLTFGMSSIKRPKASYLEITLSRLFNVLDLEEAATAIIVHLADFDEEWVLNTASKLNEGFTDEVLEGDLHVIHAPRDIYPLKQANVEAFRLSGFKQTELNERYTRHADAATDRVSYRSASGMYVLVWCVQRTNVVHRRWVLVASQDVEAAQSTGDCKARARAPEELEVLDESVRGWEEKLDGNWITATAVKLSHFVNEKGVLLKFGDSPKRTWWRTKQNLDYTFLMWYASNMSEYYMQLEDDVHPVPSFAAFVRSALERSLIGNPWVMASFSGLGFIGKLFNNTHLPSLANFLLTYSEEAPCDWLVWCWIDVWSSTPATAELPQDVEKDANKKAEAAKKGPEAVKKLPALRSELSAYYLDKSLPRVFLLDEVFQNASKPKIDANGVSSSRYPRATVESTMKTYQHYTPQAAYPPGDPLGFWSADTCSEKDKDDVSCARQKYFRLKLNDAFSADKAQVILRQGRKGHEADFIRKGELRVSHRSDCSDPSRLKDISEPEEVWEGKLEGVTCLDVGLRERQTEWVSIREIVLQSLDVEKQTSTPTALQEEPPPKADVQYSLQHALLAALVGFSAGGVAWLAVWACQCACRDVTAASGLLSWWTLYYLVALDILIYCFVTPTESSNPPVAVRQAFSMPRPAPPRRLQAQSICNSGEPRKEALALDWRSMGSGILSISPQKLVHLGPGPDPRDPKQVQRSRGLVSVGFILDPTLELAESILEGLLSAGDAVIGILVAHGSPAAQRAQRQSLLQRIGDVLRKLSPDKQTLVHLLDPSPDLYPEPSRRPDNINLALLIQFLRPLAETFMSLEWGSPLAQDYPMLIQRHVNLLTSQKVPWLCIHFSKFGHRRKLIRSKILHRWMEMLVMFPQTPADVLYWDFVDVVGNQTVPKALALGGAKGDRSDIRILYAKDKEAILEHLGDVSSLQGKVQRATEIWFKKNPLLDSLFDNPPAELTSNMEGRADLLQSLYDDSDLREKVTCGGHEARHCRDCPKGHGSSWCNVDCGWANGQCKAIYKTADVTAPAKEGSWVELTFKQGHDVEAVNLRMGGYVRPACEKCQNKGAEVPDDDFDHSLDDAEMLFGYGRSDPSAMLSCSRYTKITALAGREVFWRSSFSTPVRDVRCIRIQVTRAQQHPLVLRGIQVRTTKAKQGKAVAKVARAPLRPGGLASPSPAALRGARQAGSGRQVNGWSEQHLEWVLLTSLAAFAGAFAGVLGSLFNGKPPKRRRKVMSG
ncbi:mgat4b [Symbiodinium sp. CCMP2592]|nr:mgat4b [Symbiodinium sp. CCMP2592]